MIGMVGAYLFSRRRDANKKYGSLPLLLSIVIILLIAYKPDNVSYQVGLIAPVFVLFIVSADSYRDDPIIAPFLPHFDFATLLASSRNRYTRWLDNPDFNLHVILLVLHLLYRELY